MSILRSGVEGKAFWFHFFVSSQSDFLLFSDLKLRYLTGLLDEDHDDSGMKVRRKKVLVVSFPPGGLLEGELLGRGLGQASPQWST